MAVFSYTGIDRNEVTVRGTVAADTPRQARDRLRGQGVRVRKLVEAASPRTRRWTSRLGLRSASSMWATAVHELSMMLYAGIPMLEALDTVAQQMRQELPLDAGLIVRSDAVLRQESLRVFDRTFRITGVLRVLAIVVAMIGILGSLMALQLERTRELGLLRASGLTGPQLWRLVTTQTGIMGLVSGILALPVGIAMAAMMIYVVNRRSFGWTMPLEIDPMILLQTVAIAVGAAVLAGVIPSRRMSMVSPAEALREE